MSIRHSRHGGRNQPRNLSLIELSSFAMPTEVRSGFNTVITLANTGDSDATISLTLKNSAGTSLAVKTITLPAKTQQSRFIPSCSMPQPCLPNGREA